MRSSTILLVLVSALVAGGVSYMVAKQSGSGIAPEHETTLQRVERTGVIRCGYIVWPPYLIKDPNTNALSGLAYDYMNALAQELGLRLEWAEETGWGNYAEGLNTNRYDLVCTPVWESGTRARAALLSRPVFYDMMYAFVRADDHRFDQNFESMNKADARIAVIEGDTIQNVRRLRFPEAQELTLPQAADEAALLLSIATHKADIAFEPFDGLQRFNANRTEKLKIAAGGEPVQLNANVFPARQGETAFMAAINASIDVLNNDGRAKAIVQKYGPSFRTVAPAYVSAVK